MDSVSRNKNKAKIVSTNAKSVKKDVNAGKSETISSGGNKNTIKKKRNFNRNGRGIIYLSHIPHGFYEDEMGSYFNQFGKVTATAVARSKKTGRSKGYGFVEFRDEEVAKIAAEAMNNYFMFNRIIKCRYIPPDERKTKIFPRTYIAGDYPRKKNRITNLNHKLNALSNLDQNTYIQQTAEKINKFKKFFEENGIDFNFKFSSVQSQIEDLKSESADGANNQYGVLEIDESDKEISFKTPPKVKKIIKKSSDSPSVHLKKISSNKIQSGKKIKSKGLKKSSTENAKKMKELKKKNKKTNLGLQKVIQKEKSQSKKLEGKEKLLKKSFEAKKLKPSKKDISAAFKQKSAKIVRSDGVGTTKKKKNTKQRLKTSNSDVNAKTKIEIVI